MRGQHEIELGVRGCMETMFETARVHLNIFIIFKYIK